MALPAKSRVGPYEILGLLGAGGMGEVYRARDPRLGREVAVKVLPASFFENSEALTRFEREARIVAALSHPNILAIHDFGTQEGLAFAVTELLQGDSLRERLRAGPLPVRKALDWALQIAHGLAAAHEKGIAHRDLKPENLFITRDGHVKILDFGLAKRDLSLESGDDTNSPTLAAQTQPGAQMGTVGYMSPEQVRGARCDHRADIFSFGAVLYEMLSGKRAFLRATAAETLTAILREDVPEFAGTPGPIPVALDRIVRRCLEKNPQERFDTAHDVAFALEAVELASGRAEVSAPSALRSRSARWLFPAGLVAGAVVGAGLALRLSAPPGAPDVPSLRYVTSSGFDWAPSASPDGRMIAFCSARDGRSRIWLKQLAGGGEAALTTGPDDSPRFSADGSSVIFVRTEGERSSLYRTPLLGGEARKIVEDVIDGDGSPDGRQVAFVRWRDESGQRDTYLGVAAADGRGAREIVRVAGQALKGVRWSPDGRRLAAVGGGFSTGSNPSCIFVVGANGEDPLTIRPPRPSGSLSSVAWSPRGDAVLYSQADWAVGDVTGSVARIIRHDLRSGTSRAILWTPHSADVLDILGSDRLVFDTRSPRENLRETSLGAPSAPGARWLSRGNSCDRQPTYSPDGEWVVFASTRSGDSEIWEISTRSGTLRRLTDDPGEDVDPALSPDGGTLIFSSDRSGHFEIWTAARDGSNPRQVTTDGVDAENATMTPDGRWIVYASAHPEKAGIWKVRPDGTGATSLAAGTYILPEVSPDGQHALYLANPGSRQPAIRALRIADGSAVPFEIPVTLRGSTWVTLGRARWMPGGRSIAFVGQDETGLIGLLAQDFTPGRDTQKTRRRLAGFDMEATAESFGIAADGTRLVIAASEQIFSIAVAEGLTGIDSPLHASR